MTHDAQVNPAATPPRQLVVLDTDPGVSWALEKGLQRSGYAVQSASTIAQVVQMAEGGQVDGIIMELLPEAGMDYEALSTLLSLPNAPKVLCVSIDTSPQTVIECMRRGAANFLTKPFGLADVRAAIRQAFMSEAQPLPPHIRRPSPSTSDSSLLIGVSPAIRELRTIIQQVARTDLNCLILGESGVGKDMVAREIHRVSQRKEKPFIKVNCSALPEMLLESELFGYEKGAFTGAVTAKPGRFNLAHNGIIFLDEIGEMQSSLQAKILQVIEHKEFTKLGGSGPSHVDVQILAATNADLAKMTDNGGFRNDLYFRLNEVCIWVPPLRERKEDVPLLVHHFIQKHSSETGTPLVDISTEDLNALSEYDWPGNVRELESAVKRWLVLGKSLLAPLHARSLKGTYSPNPMPGGQPAPTATDDKPAKEKRPEPSPDEILAALRKHKWNRRKAAEDLDMSYQALRRRIEKFELDKRG